MAQTKRSKKQKEKAKKTEHLLMGEVMSYIPIEPFDESDPEHAEYIKRDRYYSNETPFGRPTVMTKQVLQKLEIAFKIGASDRLACYFAGISERTFYNYCEKYPDFMHQKEDFKQTPVFNSLRNIALAISSGSVSDSWQYLSKKQRKEFGNDKEGPEDERAYTIEEIEAIARGEFRVVEDKKTP
jgi:hypothetical protein